MTYRVKPRTQVVGPSAIENSGGEQRQGRGNGTMYMGRFQIAVDQGPFCLCLLGKPVRYTSLYGILGRYMAAICLFNSRIFISRMIYKVLCPGPKEPYGTQT